MDAGLPVPQPTVTLPPLVTPAGTTISIGQPGQGGPPTPQGGGPAPPNMQINAPGTSTPPPSTGLANGAPNGRGPQSRTARVEEEAEAEVEQVEALESKVSRVVLSFYFRKTAVGLARCAALLPWELKYLAPFLQRIHAHPTRSVHSGLTWAHQS